MHNESPAPVIALLSLIIIISPWAEKTATMSPHYLGQTKRQSHAQLIQTHGAALLSSDVSRFHSAPSHRTMVTPLTSHLDQLGEGEWHLKMSFYTCRRIWNFDKKGYIQYIVISYVSVCVQSQKKRCKSYHWDNTLSKGFNKCTFGTNTPILVIKCNVIFFPHSIIILLVDQQEWPQTKATLKNVTLLLQNISNTLRRLRLMR